MPVNSLQHATQGMLKMSSAHHKFGPSDFSVLILLPSMNPSAKSLSLLPQLPLSLE